MFNRKTWISGEKLAQNYMAERGYKIVYTNFSCVGVELDIVAVLSKRVQKKALKGELQEKLKAESDRQKRSTIKSAYKNAEKNLEDMLVITEVKAKNGEKFGRGYDAVGIAKQKHIIRGAKYLLGQKEFCKMQVRFDVASVDDGKITYFEDAFCM